MKSLSKIGNIALFQKWLNGNSNRSENPFSKQNSPRFSILKRFVQNWKNRLNEKSNRSVLLKSFFETKLSRGFSPFVQKLSFKEAFQKYFAFWNLQMICLFFVHHFANCYWKKYITFIKSAEEAPNEVTLGPIQAINALSESENS